MPEDPFIAEDGLAGVLVGVQEFLAGWGLVAHAASVTLREFKR